ncbi:MAG: hypothetical protein AAGM84_08920 [Pseudomonadota bacterium]
MSEPVQNSDVEDVLSSIRRLVSEEDRPAAKTEPPAPQADRLVLTPSLRVAEPAQPADEEPSSSETYVEPETEMYSEPGASEPLAEDVASAEPEHAPEEVAVQEVDDTTAEEEPDWEQPTSAASFEDESVVAQDDPAEPHVDEPSEVTTPETLSAKIATLEEVIARSDDQWEPDMAGTDDYAGTEPDGDMHWEDASDEEEVGGTQIFSADEDVLDEAALRDLVADIVREELQGALGERITRNVRKLVRREIHRALAAQELD